MDVDDVTCGCAHHWVRIWSFLFLSNAQMVGRPALLPLCASKRAHGPLPALGCWANLMMNMSFLSKHRTDLKILMRFENNVSLMSDHMRSKANTLMGALIDWEIVSKWDMEPLSCHCSHTSKPLSNFGARGTLCSFILWTPSSTFHDHQHAVNFRVPKSLTSQSTR